ncbi:alpha/beta-hydrolase [Daedalea quercina L-15889]|uniref:Alpha/beta-hydrolase n=1 Tax=Daedalea quercina L-15889 TaxID=1314783 RepID=A0A165UJ77_9APHY|nr:alpha/beta-hydrolase [Daedalea quercina L-15889]
MALPVQPDTQAVPLVIVEGFFCGAGAIIWGNFHQYSNHVYRAGGKEDRRVIFARVGPASSLHDRACELFFSLIGGRVDYGEEHARQHGHKRFGRTHARGSYPAWSRRNPLHFMGHSLGGPTIVKLQWLLKTGFFGARYHPDMILSVNAKVSSPFRGTQLVYLLGEDVHNAPAVRRPSLGLILSAWAHVLAYLAPILPTELDMHADARALSFAETSFSITLRRLWRSDWAETEDAAPYDVTFQAAHCRESQMEGALNPGTYYRSYAACMTENSGDGSPSTPWRHMLTMPLLCLSSRAMRHYDSPSLFLAEQESMSKVTARGDQGRVERKSFLVLRHILRYTSLGDLIFLSETKCRHSTYSLDDSRRAADMLNGSQETAKRHAHLEQGVWHVQHIDAAHHVSIVPFWVGTSRQKAFWRDLGDWLYAIDATRSTAQTM